MRSGKKVIVTIIIILLISLLAVSGAFAYLYMATDILKTDRQLFFEYFSQITSEEGFLDKKIAEFYAKKEQNAYENSGEITFEVEYPDDSMKSVIEKVNDLSIKYSGKVDSVNQKAEQNIEVDYGNNVVLPINYRQDGNKFGLQTDKLSKKFIAIKNENIDELIDNVSGDGITSMSSRINGISEILTTDSNFFSELEFSEEEKNQLKQIYNPILREALVEEKFTSTKAEQNESYILEISFQEIKDIIIKMLETTKENTLIIDKLNEAALKIDPEMEKMNTSDIDDIIKSLNEEDASQISNLKITLVQSDKQLNQIVIENQECKILISKNKTADVLKYSVDLQQIENNIHFYMQYSGLESLTNVQENYELGFDIIEDEEKMSYNYKISNNTEFVDTVSIGVIDETTAAILNDYDETQITSFLGQVGTKLLDINKKQMEELGLKEYENPVLYSNPVTMLVVSFNNMKNDTFEQENTNEISKYSGILSYKTDIDLVKSVNIEIPTVFSKGFTNETYSYNYKYDTNGGMFDECKISLGVVENYSDSNKLINEMAAYHSAIDSVKNENINNIEWLTFVVENSMGITYYCSTTYKGLVYLFQYTIQEDVSGEVNEYIKYYNSVLQSITFK